MFIEAVFAIAKTTWFAGLRGRAIQTILVFGVALMGVAYLSSAFSPRQPQTVALDVGFSMLRITLVVLGLFWVLDLIAKEIERRTVVFFLSYPIPRSYYLIGRFLGIALLLAVAVVMLSLVLLCVAFLVGGTYDQQIPVLLGVPFWLTVGGIYLDALVVTAFSLLIASFTTVSVASVALGMAFAVSGRALGAARSYILSGADGQTALVEKMGPILNLIHWILPDLSKLDFRAWALYGIPVASTEVLLAALSVAGYGIVLLALATAIFSRRKLV